MKAEYIDHMGDDLSVVNAARVSFDKVSKFADCGEFMNFCGHKTLKEPDTKLIKYLAKHNHWTPFAHTSISLRMGAPIPIRTQCFKHKQGFVENEESRRYISTTPEIYTPEVFRSAPKGSIKQGSGDEHEYSEYWADRYERATQAALEEYTDMISDGVCPEQARFVLPQGCMVNWVWTGNLMAFARYYNQRTYENAQKEGKELATLVADIIKPLYPASWAALTEALH